MKKVHFISLVSILSLFLFAQISFSEPYIAYKTLSGTSYAVANIIDNNWENTLETSGSPNLVTHVLYSYPEYNLGDFGDQSIGLPGINETIPDKDGLIPIILIHGWQGDNGLIDPAELTTYENSSEKYFSNLLLYFDNTPELYQKYRIFLYKYPSYKHISYNARILQDLIANINYFQNHKPIIIAHSMGGLVARSLIEEHGYTGAIALITLATPHHGSPAAIKNWYTPAKMFSFLVDVDTPGAQDLFWDNYDGIFEWAKEKTVLSKEMLGNVNFMPILGDGRMSGYGMLPFDSFYRNKAEQDGFVFNGVAVDDVWSLLNQQYDSDESTIHRYPNPWLTWLNEKLKKNDGPTIPYLLYAGYNETANDSQDNYLDDTLNYDAGTGYMYNRGYVNDGVVPVTSAFLDFDKHDNFIEKGERNNHLFEVIYGDSNWDWSEWKSTLYKELIQNVTKFIYYKNIIRPNISVRFFKDYNHDRMKSGADESVFSSSAIFQSYQQASPYKGELKRDPLFDTLQYDLLSIYESATPEQVTPTSIPDGVNPQNITFHWSDSSCNYCSSVEYDLEIYQNDAVIFRASDHEGHYLNTNTYSLPTTESLSSNTVYWWAVFPVSEKGVWNLDVTFDSFTTGSNLKNSQPVSVFNVIPETGDTATTITVDAGSSSDPDSDPLEFAWNWGDDVYFSAWSSNPTANHQYAATGSYDITLVIRDNNGAESYASASIAIARPPITPTKAVNPFPVNTSHDLQNNAILRWSDGGGSTNYDVYFGTSATLTGSDLVSSNQDGTSYDPDQLQFNQTYYWRVDSSNAYGTTTGDTWLFTTMPPPPWLGYYYWDFDTDGTEGWTARNATNDGIYDSEYWIIDPYPDSASKSGIVSAPGLSGLYAEDYDAIEVRAAVKNIYVASLDAYLKIGGQWQQTPIPLNYVSGEQIANSQCIYRGTIPYSGHVEQVRIDFVWGDNVGDDRVYVDKVSFVKTSSVPPGAKLVQIHNDGTLPLEIDSISIQNNSSWVIFDSSSILPGTTIEAGGFKEFTVSVDQQGLSDGNYDDNIVINSNDDNKASTLIPITLQVGTVMTPPELTSFNINYSGASTVTRDIILINSASGNPLEYQTSELPDFSDSTWKPYTDSPLFTLSSTYGVKTVYLKVRNSSGESPVLSDTILLIDPAQNCDTLKVTAYAGSEIYTPPAADYQYHYGPSIILTGDTVDMWACSPDPSPDSWDRIEHHRGTIGAGGIIQWTTDWISVLEATPNSRDRYSACDPGVFSANGYYYIGYTSTDQAVGDGATSNDVFVARCNGLPDGSAGVTCEKWNGTGWGGDPEPIIEYTGDSWGIGQPSFVVKDNILYVYYTDNGTKVATADITNVNWPLTLDFSANPILVNEQATIDLGGKPGPLDVKYVDDLGRFVGVGVSYEFNSSSNVFVYESLDGLNFTPVATSRDYWTAGIVQDRAHNIGLSGDSYGHIQISNSNFIAYAYGRPKEDLDAEYKASWPTYLNPIDISLLQQDCLTVAFSADRTTGIVPSTITFSDQSAGAINSWAWDFNGDGLIDSTEQDPTFTYNIAGVYDVSLTVTTDNSSLSEVKPNYISITSSSVLHTLTTTVTGQGSIVSNPAGINCGSDCEETFDEGTAVTLSAIPATNYTFTGWTGGGCIGTEECTVTMNTDNSVSAAFNYTSSATYGLLISPSIVNFFGADVGGATEQKSLSVTNSGTADVDINFFTLSGPGATDFTIPVSSDNCSGVILTAGNSCSIVVEFSPSSEGNKQATLSLTSLTPEIGTQNIPISGTGLKTGSNTFSTFDSPQNFTYTGTATYYTIDLIAGQGVSVVLNAHMTTSYMDFGLFDTNDVELAGSNDSTIYDADSGQLSFTPKVSGVYYIKVWGTASSIGTYDLAVYNAWFNAGTLDTDRDFYASLHMARYLADGNYVLSNDLNEYFRFTAVADEPVIVNLTPHINVGNLDINLLDQQGTRLHYSDGVTNGVTRIMTYTPKVSGVYYLRIDRDSGAYGDYDISMTSGYLPDVDSDNDNLFDAAEYFHDTNLTLPDSDGDGVSDYDEIAAGQCPVCDYQQVNADNALVIGTAVAVPYKDAPFNVVLPGHVTWFSFTLEANEGISIALSPHINLGNLDLNLFDSEGTRLLYRDGITNGLRRLLNYTATVGGIYYIRIDQDSGAYGNFDLAMYNAWFNAGILDNDRDFYASRNTARYMADGNYVLSNDLNEYFRFTATAGEPIVVDVTAHINLGDLDINLLDQQGNLLKYTNNIVNDSTGIMNYTPTLSGVYYLRIDRDNGAYGNYDISSSHSIIIDEDNDGYTVQNGDCNDNDPTIYPGATEICDGIINNCNGTLPISEIDNDNDNYVECNIDSNGWDGNPAIHGGLDCNDNDSFLNPGVIEVCDGKDNNCDGQIDEGVTFTYYADLDGDGFGQQNLMVDTCSQPDGYTTNSDDCNDYDNLEYPGQIWYKDEDNDGYSDGTINDSMCVRPDGYYIATELIATSGDPDDTDPTITPVEDAFPWNLFLPAILGGIR